MAPDRPRRECGPTAEVLASLHDSALSAPGPGHTRPWAREEFEALLSSPHCFAVGDSRSAALARVVGEEAELLTLATRPDSRREGLARKTMEAWHREAARRGARRAFLEVAADNVPALELYRNCGYRQVGSRQSYYRPGAESAPPDDPDPAVARGTAGAAGTSGSAGPASRPLSRSRPSPPVDALTLSIDLKPCATSHEP